MARFGFSRRSREQSSPAEIIDAVPEPNRRDFLYWRATSLAAVVLANVTMPPLENLNGRDDQEWPGRMRISVGTDGIAHFARGLGRQAKVDAIARGLAGMDSEHIRLQLSGFTDEQIRMSGGRSPHDYPVLVFGIGESIAVRRGMRGSQMYEGSYYTTDPIRLSDIDSYSQEAVRGLIRSGRLMPLSLDRPPARVAH